MAAIRSGWKPKNSEPRLLLQFQAYLTPLGHPKFGQNKNQFFFFVRILKNLKIIWKSVRMSGYDYLTFEIHLICWIFYLPIRPSCGHGRRFAANHLKFW